MKNLWFFWMSSVLRQGKVMAVLLLMLVLIIINAYTYLNIIEEHGKQRDEIRANHRETLSEIAPNPDEFSGESLTVQLPPGRFVFFVDNDFDSLPVQRTISPVWKRIPFSRGSNTSLNLDNESIDLSFIVEVVLTFLAVILTFDVINGERRQGTLKLLLANNVPRWKLLISKYLAVLTVLAVPLALGLLIHLILVISFSAMAISTEVLLMYLFFFIYAFVLLGVFASLGFLVSSTLREPVTGFVILVLVWSMLVIVVPGGSKLVGKALSDVQSSDEYWVQYNAIQADAQQKAIEAKSATRPPEMARQDNFAGERRFNEIRREEYASLTGLGQQHINSVFQEADLIHSLSLLSPTFAFRSAVSSTTDNHFDRIRRFITASDQYANALFQVMKTADADDPDSPHLLYMGNAGDGGYLSQEPFEVPLPTFTFNDLPLAERLLNASGYLGLLILELGLLLFLATVAFNRFDVR